MNKIKTTLILIFVLIFVVVFASKSIPERPITYQFIFQNQDTVLLNNPSYPLIQSYSDDIINGKIKLQSVELLFASGIRLTFITDGKNWTQLKITKNKKRISFPQAKIKKISIIRFETLVLLRKWNGNENLNENFKTNSFSIVFDIGKEKSNSQYPDLILSFSRRRFKKAYIWRQISEKSIQMSDF